MFSWESFTSDFLPWLIVGASASWLIFRTQPKTKMELLPKGIKGNNPLNIRYYRGTEWLGSETHKDGEEFVIFKSAEYGIRAAAKILASYRERDITTINEIIKRWAPESENPTKSYVDFVAKNTKIQKNQEIKSSDYLAIISSMIFFENGVQPYSKALLKKGILLS